MASDYNPQNGDGPFDALCDIDRRVIAPEIFSLLAKKVSKRWRSAILWDRVGTILLLARSHAIPLTVLETAIEYVREVLDDEKYCASWRDPNEFVRVANAIRDKLNAAIERDKERTVKFQEHAKLRHPECRRSRGVKMARAPELAELIPIRKKRTV